MTDHAAAIAGPRAPLIALRFLLAGGEGGGWIAVSLGYEGGLAETRRLPFPDWFADPRPPIGDDDPFVAGGLVATAILNDMDRIYRGRFDDSRPRTHPPMPVTGRDIRAAADAVLGGTAVPQDQKGSVGCNIKWKRGNAPDYF